MSPLIGAKILATKPIGLIGFFLQKGVSQRMAGGMDAWKI
jgi:hypothetical protein